jgi:hypothetical protein
VLDLVVVRVTCVLDASSRSCARKLAHEHTSHSRNCCDGAWPCPRAHPPAADGACADDPYWWTEAQLALVRGTRLSRAIAQHTAGLHAVQRSVQRLAHTLLPAAGARASK